MAIGITNAGGVNAWAMVLINYPSGSTLTATNVSGKKDISATQRLYYVKKPSGTTQTCTFTITDGTHTRTETISGIAVGTAQTITMAYNLILLPIDSASSYWRQINFVSSAPSYGTTTVTNSTISCVAGDVHNCIGCGSINTYDNSAYSTVKINVSVYDDGRGYGDAYLCLSTNSEYGYSQATSRVEITGTGEYSIPLTSTPQYISFGWYGTGWTSYTLTINSIILE